MQLTMQGFGNNLRDGIPGDLCIIIDELREFYFRRESNNIIVEKEISVIDAILGSQVQVKTPQGDIPITIDPGTEHGKNIRVTGKGVPDMSIGLGDLYINIKVKIPKTISSEERDTLVKLKDSNNFVA